VESQQPVKLASCYYRSSGASVRPHADFSPLSFRGDA
jgi:hypothetical protein